MSHKKIQGKVVRITGRKYRVGKFNEVTQPGKKVGKYRIYKRGNSVYETYRAPLYKTPIGTRRIKVSDIKRNRNRALTRPAPRGKYMGGGFIYYK